MRKEWIAKSLSLYYFVLINFYPTVRDSIMLQKQIFESEIGRTSPQKRATLNAHFLKTETRQKKRALCKRDAFVLMSDGGYAMNKQLESDEKNICKPRGCIFCTCWWGKSCLPSTVFGQFSCSLWVAILVLYNAVEHNRTVYRRYRIRTIYSLDLQPNFYNVSR